MSEALTTGKIEISFVDGEVGATLTVYDAERGAWIKHVRVNPESVVQQYTRRWDAVRDRNPDMTAKQVHDFVLAEWYRELRREM